MSSGPDQRSGPGAGSHLRVASLLRTARLSALVALVAAALLAALIIDFVISNLGYVLLALLGLLAAVLGAWAVVTKRRLPRGLASVGMLAGIGLVVAAVVGASSDGGQVLLRLVVLTVLVLIFAVAGRGAMISSLRALSAIPIRRAAPPRRPVLICNPRSGGGKVEKFDLLGLASSMGIETVVLEPGLDLEVLARDAVARGADCLGMAGGDGSQALVASIAVEHRLPFVCISAGTRNHFALDLGLNRDDPRLGLQAYRDGVRRRVDFATVNGRVFVNNVSLGVYATIVQQEGYREAKAATTASLLPDLLGERDQPFDLQFTGPDDSEVEGSFLIQVSNNPYVLGPSLDLSRRRRLDQGQLGVFAVTASSGTEAAHVVTTVLAGRSLGSSGGRVFDFTVPAFEVRSRSGRAYAGIDGEALEMETPLDFRIHPQGLELLVPEGNVEEAIRRRAHEVGLHDLVSLVLHPGDVGDQAG